MLNTYNCNTVILIVKEREAAAGRDPYNMLITPDDTEYMQVAAELDLPTYEWVLNEEYTTEQLLIEHPFFGNVSEMVAVRMAAINELQALVNEFTNPLLLK